MNSLVGSDGERNYKFDGDKFYLQMRLRLQRINKNKQRSSLLNLTTYFVLPSSSKFPN